MIDVVKSLGKIPQLADKAARDAARAEFLPLVKAGAITVDPDVMDHHSGDIDDGLYIGAHECEQMAGEDVYVELWAFPDLEPESDFLGWELWVYGHRVSMPLRCCPFCGIALYDLITQPDGDRVLST